MKKELSRLILLTGLYFFSVYLIAVKFNLGKDEIHYFAMGFMGILYIKLFYDSFGTFRSIMTKPDTYVLAKNTVFYSSTAIAMMMFYLIFHLKANLYAYYLVPVLYVLTLYYIFSKIEEYVEYYTTEMANGSVLPLHSIVKILNDLGTHPVNMRFVYVQPRTFKRRKIKVNPIILLDYSPSDLLVFTNSAPGLNESSWFVHITPNEEEGVEVTFVFMDRLNKGNIITYFESVEGKTPDDKFIQVFSNREYLPQVFV